MCVYMVVMFYVQWQVKYNLISTKLNAKFNAVIISLNY